MIFSVAGLPEPSALISQAKNTAFPEITLYFAAIVGFTLVVLIIKSFVS